MRDYFLTLFAVLVCADAQYFYPEPSVPELSTDYLPPPAEYLPPPPPSTTTTTTTTPRPVPTTEEPDVDYTPDSNIPDFSILRTTTTTQPPITTEHEHHHHHHEVPFWDFRESIPGEPEADYPILDKIPPTGFACNGRLDGYYADLEARCQVFHVCSKLPDGEYVKSSYLCPNGTIFHQENFSCQWWADVDCAVSDNFYNLNALIGVVPEDSGTSIVNKRSAVATLETSSNYAEKKEVLHNAHT